MSTLVTNEFFAQLGHGDDDGNLLIEILGESLQHDGCEFIRIVAIRTTRITSPESRSGLSATTSKASFAWRTEQGFTAAFEARLSRPLVDFISYDIAYFGEGIASSRTSQL